MKFVLFSSLSGENAEVEISYYTPGVKAKCKAIPVTGP
jgi:hypothetical protein